MGNVNYAGFCVEIQTTQDSLGAASEAEVDRYEEILVEQIRQGRPNIDTLILRPTGGPAVKVVCLDEEREDEQWRWEIEVAIRQLAEEVAEGRFGEWQVQQ